MASRVFDFSDEDKKIEAKDRAVLDPSKGMATGTIEQTSHMITPEHPMFVLYDEGRTLVPGSSIRVWKII